MPTYHRQGIALSLPIFETPPKKNPKSKNYIPKITYILFLPINKKMMLETQAYFENIKQVIAEHLEAAERSIFVAVAWFTDKDLYDILCRKARAGLRCASLSWTMI